MWTVLHKHSARDMNIQIKQPSSVALRNLFSPDVMPAAIHIKQAGGNNIETHHDIDGILLRSECRNGNTNIGRHRCGNKQQRYAANGLLFPIYRWGKERQTYKLVNTNIRTADIYQVKVPGIV